MPVARRNARVKLDCEENWQWRAISLSDARPVAIIALALSSRRRLNLSRHREALAGFRPARNQVKIAWGGLVLMIPLRSLLNPPRCAGDFSVGEQDANSCACAKRQRSFPNPPKGVRRIRVSEAARS
jgi:hypothetical protein